MIPRLIKLPKDQNILLFGARGCGKSTLIEERFDRNKCFWIDLLDSIEEDRFSRNPNELKEIVLALPEYITHIVIDEIQKIPQLLDVVHYLIEHTNKYFILTGSSARKLKYGGANLLAGRAFVYHLFPFSYLELKNEFNLSSALQWGLLPKIISLKDDDARMKFLQSYALTYLKEEIWAEQIVRNLNPFRKFLEVAAQSNGKMINYANLARDVDVDDKTIKEYFIILEDTLIGFMLEPFHHSFRKRLTSQPKFYFFDTGVVRALARHLSLPLVQSTSAYGDTFEHFIIVECLKLASYFFSEYRFSYLKTKDDVEVDLIVDRPGLPPLFIEIKSASQVTKDNLRSFIQLTKDFKDCEAVCFSNDPHVKQIEHVTVFPWQEGIKKYFSNI